MCECGHAKKKHNLIYITPDTLDFVGSCDLCECNDFRDADYKAEQIKGRDDV